MGERLIEKRRVPIPEPCGEPHPTLEWQAIDHDTREYVYYASTCWLSKGHDGAHRALGPGGASHEWPSEAVSTGRELLVAGGDPPSLVVDSFEGVDVPFDRDKWRDRILRRVRRSA